MNFFQALYQLFIGPIELFFDVVFTMAYRVVHHPGLAIIILSLAMNFLVLPLYRRADAIQAEERDQAAKMKHWVDHIKRTFKGDQRFMTLQTYYRQNNYKPSYVLKGSLPLLLQIPFFMAAYRFLSGLRLLEGVSFGPIRDLGSPDAMFTIAGFTINVLPILMTLINVISGIIYTRGFPLKSKIQLYAMALVFLVLLYNSPSGLVFYWTLNNVFSLAKGIFNKLKKPARTFGILCSAVSAAFLVFLLFIHPMATMRRQVLMIAVALALNLPLVYYFISTKMKPREERELTADEKKTNNRIFWSGAAFLAILTGLLIPSAVLNSSPSEFVSVTDYQDPLHYLVSSVLFAAGLFVVWFGIFYLVANPRGKKYMGLGVWVLSGVMTVNYMFFGRDLGVLSSTLQYENTPVFSIPQQLINLGVIAAVAVVLFLCWRYLRELTKVIILAGCLAILGMSVFNVVGINQATERIRHSINSIGDDVPHITLSRTEKNVVVIMLDRAISSYVPYMFEEKPELKTGFDGFTYYPNTVSYGAYTNTGSAGLFGGYEYIPEEMNKRTEEKLVTKQNEALKVMPVIFDRAGYRATVCDPSYAGYLFVPDLSIYNDYPNIKRYITMGNFHVDGTLSGSQVENVRNRNFFCYSIMKSSPLIGQMFLYNSGAYNEADSLVLNGKTQRTFAEQAFLDCYAVLKKLPELTVVDDEAGTFTMISNKMTHEIWQGLQEPEYEPSDSVDNAAYDAAHSDRFTLNGVTLRMDTEDDLRYYQANMGAFLKLGKWFEWLKSIGAYDNTRIIIVSDHGYFLREREDMLFGDEQWEDAMLYNALLLVKDFGATGELTTDMTFMTNADVPTLATRDTVKNPVNPFTGKAITSDHKNGPQNIFFSSGDGWDVSVNKGNVFMPGEWYRVRDNIFDRNNWSYIGTGTSGEIAE